MKNPFENIDNYTIKMNYNRIRTNSKDSVKSAGSNPNRYIPNFKQLQIQKQYKERIIKAQNLQRESLKIYGVQSFRFKPTYFNHIEHKQENKDRKLSNNDLDLPPLYITRRQSDSIGTLVKIGEQSQAYNSNDYNSGFNVNSINSINDNQPIKRKLERNCSIFKSINEEILKAKLDIYPQHEDQCYSSNNVFSSFKSSKKSFSSNQRMQSDLIDIDNSNSSNNRTKKISERQIIKSKKKIKPSAEEINVKGKQFFISEYYRI